ncbi:gastrula zinc finger protein xFG20-1 [Phthorimaea operculella]|nr:gastrula zinc finger protein xFG20-1 [Phthorimaea operculella]
MAENDEIPAVPATDSETTCSLCYAEFLDPEDLVVHFNQVHVAECSVHCQFCTLIFPSLDSYAIHIRNVHVLSFRACKYCHKVFVDTDSFRKHQKRHQAPHNAIKCSQCESQFENMFELQQHELENHDNDTDGVLMNSIFPVLSSCLNIKALNFIQSFGQNAAYICACCSFTTPTPDDYINHLQTSKCRSVVCNTCCNVYKDKKGLLKHLENHKECFIDAKEEDLYKECSKCKNKVLVSSYSSHYRTCKPLKCSLCDIILFSVDEMTYHQSTEHPMAITMERCKFCHKEFVGKSNVQKHIDRKHKKEFHLYKYRCVYCEDMYFVHPQKLFCHYFSKHTELQPYCCKICNTKFRIRKKFTIHIKLEHKSVGFVEFDENYHVFFTDKKSENPFIPKSLFKAESSRYEEIDDNEEEQNQLLNEQTEAPTDFATDAPTDVPTDCPTDAPTDTEDNKLLTQRKPPKIRFKEQKKSKELETVTVKTEVQSEANQSEYETRAKTKLKKQKKTKKRKLQVTDDSDSEDEPLIKIQRKSKTRGVINKWNMKKKDVKMGLKKRFTCNICKKYCYTYQNYNHHMSLHFKDEIKKCVKCSMEFPSKKELKKHVDKEHSTSRLTETLKTLLERRKMGKSKDGVITEIPKSEKFRRTIKRYKSEPMNANVAAKITEVKDNLSVKNFIESFTPEEMEAKKEKPVEIQASVTVKRINRKIMRPPAIKMTKFVPKPQPTNVKLALPETHSTKETVPEVAEEVMLESQEQQQKAPAPVMPHKIVIPKLPKNYTNDDIKIAHLLPHAPFYKIVKMKDVLETQNSNQNQQNNQATEGRKTPIKLPGGTKLVNVNPLAHLLGNTPVEKILGPSSKNYKPKIMDNVENAIANALLKLENNTYNRRRKKKNQAELDADNAEMVEIEQ